MLQCVCVVCVVCVAAHDKPIIKHTASNQDNVQDRQKQEMCCLQERSRWAGLLKWLLKRLCHDCENVAQLRQSSVLPLAAGTLIWNCLLTCCLTGSPWNPASPRGALWMRRTAGLPPSLAAARSLSHGIRRGRESRNKYECDNEKR